MTRISSQQNANGQSNLASLILSEKYQAFRYGGVLNADRFFGLVWDYPIRPVYNNPGRRSSKFHHLEHKSLANHIDSRAM
jgi:hypothetical protein